MSERAQEGGGHERRAALDARAAGEWESFTLLTRTFFARFFDSELLSPRSSAPAALWLAAFIAAPGLLKAFRLLTKYLLLAYRPLDVRVMATWPDKLFFICWAMATTGFLTLLAWEALLPDRRDCLILDALPVSRRTCSGARLAALLLFFIVMVGCANGFATVIYPTVVMDSHPPVSLAAYFTAHLVSVVTASAFVFFGLLLLQILLVNTSDPRWFRRAVTLAQSASVIILLLLFLVKPPVPLVEWVRGDADAQWMAWVPPFWFLGLYETMIGTSATVFHGAARQALIAVSATTIGTIVLYVATYGRHVRRMIESPETGRGSVGARVSGLVETIAARVVPGSIERAVFEFTLLSLVRSAKHRVVLSGYLGVGVAFLIADVLRAWLRGGALLAWPPTVTALAMPLVLSFFVLAGMRVSFATPTDVAANWSFRVTEVADRREYAGGVRKALLLGGLVPIAGTFPIYAIAWDVGVALAHAWCCLAMARLLIAILTFRFPRVPFTYVTLPGSANIKAWWPLYVAGFSMYAYVPAVFERHWLTSPSGLVRFFAIAAVVEIALRLVSWRMRVRGGALVYEDDTEPILQLHLTP